MTATRPCSPNVAVGQFAAGSDPLRNRAEIRRIARQARLRGASLLVLPEYSAYATPVLDQRVVTNAEDIDGPFAGEMRELARELEIAVVVGMTERIPGSDRVYNTVLLVDPSGELAETYRKAHLYDAFGQRESTWIMPPELAAPATMTVDRVTFGVQTCYDLRFPEVTRRLVDAGVDVVLVPAQWLPGPAKVRHWRTLLTARAIENTIYVCGADQAAPRGCGNSMIVDPMGHVLAKLDRRPGIASADVDRTVIASVRRTNPSLRARRYAVVPRIARSFVRLAYSELGSSSNPALVLLHGLGSARDSWDDVVPALAQEHHVFALDLRGHGGSPRCPGAYRLDDYVADVSAFLETAELGCVVLVGHSLGGSVALAVAQALPHRVRGLVLEDPPLYGIHRAVGEPRPAIDSYVRTREELRARAPDDDGAAAADASGGADRAIESPDPEVYTPVIDDRGVAGSRLSDPVVCPVLVLRADAGLSPAFTPGDAGDFARTNPAATIIEMTGATHFIHRDRRAEFVVAVLALVSATQPCCEGGDTGRAGEP